MPKYLPLLARQVTTRGLRTSRPALPAAVVALLLCVSCAGGSHSATNSSSVLRGTFTLWSVKTLPNPCSPRPGYLDVVAGARVAATDGHGRTLAAGTLSHPKSDPFHLGCVFGFTLKHLPVANSYTIAIGRRDGLTYSYDELAKTGWQVTLNLGAPPPKS
jgi:hypothetical protein